MSDNINNNNKEKELGLKWKEELNEQKKQNINNYKGNVVKLN